MDRQRVRKYVLRTWRQWRLTIFLIIFVVIPVKSSLADWNWVPTGSMLPTILEGDLIYVDKLAYDLRLPLTLSRLAKWADPERGDIVICFSPEDDSRLVKRVIAVPGDVVEMKNSVLFLNGRGVHYLKPQAKYAGVLPDKLRNRCILATEELDGVAHAVMSTPGVRAMRSFRPVTVPEGHYFVMGDNRDNSRDSRVFGLVERGAIVGKAKRVIISFDITDKYQPRLARFFDRLQ